MASAVAPANTQLRLTVVIPTLNEARQIGEALDALPWADEVIVADGGSTDDTVAIARARGATVLELSDATIGAQRNAAIAQARNLWILALDADERVTAELADELSVVLARPAHEAYQMRDQTFFLGRERKRGRWSRDWHVRLFQQDRRFGLDRVHERLAAPEDIGSLSGRLHHTPYRDLTHQLDKILLYARWGAEGLQSRGRTASWSDLTVRPLWRFVRDYFVYGSCLDGRYGLVTSALTALSGFLKYAYLWEIEQRARSRFPDPRDHPLVRCDSRS